LARPSAPLSLSELSLLRCDDAHRYLLFTTLNDTLCLSVYDFNDHRKDGELGVVSFDLKKLADDAEHENVEGQVLLQGKPRGFLKYDVRYFPVLTPKKLPDGTEEVVPETRACRLPDALGGF
jgi:Ca2+-dependent lipid-binding protein